MSVGALTSYMDVAQVTLYAFWIFFAGLLLYLRREDRREGYPLVEERKRSPHAALAGVPKPKTFLLAHGGSVQAPRAEPPEPPITEAIAAGAWFGAPLVPTGNPMLDALGPSAYANRKDTPELTFEGEPRMAPLRVAHDFFVEPGDVDPRGLDVVALDRKVAGTVTEVWVDRTEPSIRYLEVAVSTAAAPRTVLLPMVFVNSIEAKGRRVTVSAITAAQFADVPVLANPDVVTTLEEDKISAYYGGGFLWATPQRREPLI